MNLSSTTKESDMLIDDFFVNVACHIIKLKGHKKDTFARAISCLLDIKEC